MEKVKYFGCAFECIFGGIFGGAALFILILDQATKWWVVQSRFTPILYNSGISFGFFASQPLSVVAVASVVLLIGGGYFFRSAIKRQPVVWGAIFGGAISNLLDRIWYSGVRDWLPVPGLRVQNNLADWAVVIGLVLVATLEWRAEMMKKEKASRGE